jgi:hypothetical protein
LNGGTAVIKGNAARGFHQLWQDGRFDVLGRSTVRLQRNVGRGHNLMSAQDRYGHTPEAFLQFL